MKEGAEKNGGGLGDKQASPWLRMGWDPSFLTLWVQGDSLVVCEEVNLVPSHLCFLHPPMLLPAFAPEGLCCGPVVVGGKLEVPWTFMLFSRS